MKVGSEGVDKVMGEGCEIADERHGFPAAGVGAEAQAELPTAEWRAPGDGRALVGKDGQVSAFRPDRDMPVGAKGVDRPAQDIRVLRGEGREPGPWAPRHGRAAYAAFAGVIARPACNG